MTTLTDRYVDAAMRTVPEKQRADLAAELRASIDDQIEARVIGGASAPDAERAVLTELGDPEVLAAGYVDRPLHLIGPRYYLTWWRLLKLLWAIVPACAAFAVALGQTISGASVGEIIGTTVATVFSVIVQIGFWTTLVFFIVERAERGKDSGVVSAWTPDHLPEARERGLRVSDLVTSLVLLAVAAAAVVWDHFFGFVYRDGGWLPFLDPGLWPWWTAGLIVIIAGEAALIITAFVQGRWRMGTAVVNLCLNLAFVIPALWLLLNGRLVDPEFFASIMPADSAETVGTIVPVLIGFGIVAVAGWDSLDAFLKARRSRPGGPAAAALG